MPIYDFKLFQFNLTFNKTVRVYGKPITRRTGLIIQLQDSQGHIGYGETSPLPVGQTEDFAVVLEQLKGFKKYLKNHPCPVGVEKLDGKFNTWLSDYPLSSAARFGVESAILSILADSRQQSLSQLLDAESQTQVQINRLLTGDKKNILSQAESFLKAGESALKVKIGQQNLNEDIALVNDLAALIAGRALLRLDANQAYSYDEALRFCRSVDYGAIEYIEEPLKDFSRIAELYDEVLIPFAVDESLKHHSLKELKSINGVEVIIVKPTGLGGLERSALLMNEAMNYGLRPVVSSSYESSIGIRILANFASAYAKHTAAGLDTLRWFKDDLTDQPVKIHHGRISIAETLPHLFKLRPAVIEEIPC